jgi:hypothetical protein
MAAAMLAGSVLQVGLQTRSLRQQAERRPALWTPRAMFALAAAYAGAFACARLLDGGIPGVTGLLAAGIAGTACFVVLLVACGGVLPRDRERLSALQPRRRRWTEGEASA